MAVTVADTKIGISQNGVLRVPHLTVAMSTVDLLVVMFSPYQSSGSLDDVGGLDDWTQILHRTSAPRVSIWVREPPTTPIWEFQFTAPTGFIGFVFGVRGTSDLTPDDTSYGTGTLPSLTASADDSLLFVSMVYGPGQSAAVPSPLVHYGSMQEAPSPFARAYLPTSGATGDLVFTPASLEVAGVILKPSNRAPLAPALIGTTDLDFDAGSDIKFRWAFQDPDSGDTQSAYQFRRKTTGAYSYWDGDSWESSAVWVTSDDSEVVFPASAWANGVTYSWSVRTKDQDGEEGAWASDASVRGSLPPVVAVSAPSGTVDTTTRPTVTWTFTDPEGSSQERYEVKVFTAATYGAGGFDPATSLPAWSSGVTLSSSVSRQVGVGLVNGGTYRAYVRAAQSGPQWSSWAYSEFTLDVEAPGVPTLVVTPDPSTGSVSLAATGDDTTYLGDVLFRFEVLTAAGWEPVRGGESVVPDGDQEGSVLFWEATPHSQMSYRVVAYTTEPGDLIETPSAIVMASLDLTSWWLVDPLEPGDSMALEVLADPAEFASPEDQAVFAPLGRSDPVVISGVIRSGTVAVSAAVFTRVALNRLAILRGKQRTLLLQPPWPQHWYVRFPSDPRMAMEPFGEFVEAPIVRVPLVFTVVGAP